MHEAFRSDIAKKVQAARDEADQKKRMTLGAFAQIQFAMYAAHNADFNSHTMRILQKEVEEFLGILRELTSTEDHFVMAMAGASEPLPLANAGPAELTGQGEPKPAWEDLKGATISEHDDE